MTQSCMNSVCPVCGGGIAVDMPPLSFHPEKEGSHSTDDEGTFRVCCAPCAALAQLTPQRYHDAACTNSQVQPLAPPADDRP